MRCCSPWAAVSTTTVRTEKMERMGKTGRTARTKRTERTKRSASGSRSFVQLAGSSVSEYSLMISPDQTCFNENLSQSPQAKKPGKDNSQLWSQPGLHRRLHRLSQGPGIFR